MGNFSISHYAAIRIEPDAVRLRYLVDLAEIPTFQALQESPLPLEPQDPAVRAYLARTVETLGDALTLELDGRRLALRVESSDLIFPPGAGGLRPSRSAPCTVPRCRPRGRARPWSHIPGRELPGAGRLEGDRRQRGARRDAGREHRARARPKQRADRLSDRPRREPAPGPRGAGRLHARGHLDLGRPPGPGARTRPTARRRQGAWEARAAREPSRDGISSPDDTRSHARGGARLATLSPGRVRALRRPAPVRPSAPFGQATLPLRPFRKRSTSPRTRAVLRATPSRR